MIRSVMLLLATFGLLLPAGCTTDGVQHGLYEGFRVRNDLQSSPSERIGKPDSLDYQEYNRLRKERQ